MRTFAKTGLVAAALLALLPGLAWAVPTASNQSITVAPNLAFPGRLLSVGYSGASGTVTVTIVSQPSHGTLAPYSASYPQYFYYLPATDYQGSDSFTWKVTDSTGTSNTATYSIAAANTVPTANSSSVSVNCNTRSSVSLSVTDPDSGQIRTFTRVSGPSHGTLEMPSPTTGTGYAYYTADPGYVGSDSFQWKVSDGLATSNTATCSITVNASVPVPKDQTVLVAKDTATDIQPSYTGGGGYTLTFVKASYPPSAAGTLTVVENKFRFVPKAGYTGVASFTWKIQYSNASTPATYTATATCTLVVKGADGPDWPQWRCDAMRTGMTTQALPDNLRLQWRRDLPVLSRTWTRSSYHQFDGRYEPVVVGQTLFVGSTGRNGSDSVTALDARTGAQKWRFYADGPVRFAPAAVRLASGQVVVCFVSDDGHCYGVNGADGTLRWKVRAGPANCKVFGNDRMISTWPMRGAPVCQDGRVYVAAGFLPHEGIFVLCLDAATGAVIWKNDSGDGHASTTPHDSPRKQAGGPPPQGYLSVIGDLLWMPTGRTYPGRFELATGSMLSWAQGSLNGATSYDDRTNDNAHTGGGWWLDPFGSPYYTVPSVSVTAGSTTYTASTAAGLGVSGTVVSMIAADDRMFVATAQGSIYCFGGTAVTPQTYSYQTTPLPGVNDAWKTLATRILTDTGNDEGCAYVLGLGTGRLAEELVRQTSLLHVVAVDPDPAKVAAFRDKMDAAGLYGTRCAAVCADPLQAGLPPCTGRLIVSETPALSGFLSGDAATTMMYEAVRPYGGTVWIASSNAQHSSLSAWISAATPPGATLARVDGTYSVLTRAGALPGAADYYGGSQNSPDEYARAPFGVQWFDDRLYYGLGHSSFVQPDIVGGEVRHTSTVDAYTGLPLTYAARVGAAASAPKETTPNRTNPFYLIEELRVVNTGYGCDGGAAPLRNYTYLQTGRSGSLGIYDRRTESGTIQINPIRTGCDPSSTPGNGILLVGAAGCGCDYPLTPVTMALMHRPDTENWAIWSADRSTRELEEEPVRRLGVNFGAPAEQRNSETLWLHYPRKTKPTPFFPIKVEGPAVRAFYHHASRVLNDGLKWVASSGVTGATRATIGLTPESAVADVCAQAPVIDGQFGDSCWDGRHRMFMCDDTDATDVYLRYDAQKLYIGCRRRAPQPVNWKPFADRPGVWRVFIGDRAHLVDSYVHLETFADGTREDYLKISGVREEDVTWEGNWTSAVTAGVTNTTMTDTFVAEFAVPWSTLTGAGLDIGSLVFDITAPNWYSAPNVWFQEYAGGQGAYDMRGRHFQWAPLTRDAAYGAMNDTRSYTVSLHFAETEGATAGQRVFDVKIQGATVRSRFDIAAAASGPNRAVVLQFDGIQARDELVVDLVPVVGEPLISGIELIAGSSSPTPPHITSPLTASATVGQAFSYTITASGSAPITFGATNLPGGLTRSGAVISGMPTAAGAKNVTLTATNSVGTDTKTLIITVVAANSAPIISSYSPASPAVVAAGSSHPFSVDAWDADGDALSYAWKLDGGTAGVTGSVFTYSPTAADAGVHSIEVTVSDDKGGSVKQTWSVTVTVPATPPSITTQPANRTVTAGQTATFSVVAAGTAPLSYQWQKNGTNFSGATSASYTTPAITTADNGAKFKVTVTNTAGSVTSTEATLTVNPVPSDLPAVTLTAYDAWAAEPGSDTGRFKFYRTNCTTTAALTVKYTMSGTATNNSDYQSLTGSVTIPAGTRTAYVYVTPLDDTKVEGAETVTMTVASDAAYVPGSPDSATVTLLDDETPIITVSTSDAYASETGSDTGAFRVARGGSTTAAVTVKYTAGGTAANGTDYQALTGSVVIPAGKTSSYVYVTALDDTLVEDIETVVLTVSEDASYQVGKTSVATVKLLDDEMPILTVKATDAVAAEPSADKATFTITRSGKLNAALTVTYKMSGVAKSGTDYAAPPGTVTLASGATSATVTITAIDDTLVEGRESVTLALVSSSAYQLGSPSSATLYVYDDEKPYVSITASDSKAYEAGLDPGEFTVSCLPAAKTATAVALTVTGTATPGSDYQALPASVTIAAGASSTKIAVRPADDAVNESSESVRVALAAGTTYQAGSPSSATVYITSNE